MLNEFGYAEKIEELVKAGKADDSVLKTINDNEEEQKKTNENLDILLKKIEKLEETNRRVEDFLANVSHELRTPINAVTGISTVMLQKEEEQEKREQRAIMHLQA